MKLRQVCMDFIILENNRSGQDEKRCSLRVLLVQSPTGRAEVPIYPLGLAFLAGQLRGHDLRGLDMSPGLFDPGSLKRELEDFGPDLVAISLRNIDDSSYPVTHSYVEPFTRLVEELEEWPGTVLVGGTGFSIYPGIILERHPRIDYGLPGEGETVLPEFLAHLEGGPRPEGWEGGRLLPWRKPELAGIGLPDYSVFDVSDYPVPDSIGVQSRRGCAYGCTYCTYGYLGGREFRTRPVSHVMEDIRQLESMGVKRFQFVDSVFNAPKDYFLELLDVLEEEGTSMSWSAWLDESVGHEQLPRMRKAGAVKVDFSPDAITDRGLRLLGKRGRSRDLLPAVRAAREAGLQVGINFFNGNPGEGLPAFLGKLAFMLRVRLRSGWRDTFVNIGTIRVYAHSPLARQMVESGMLPGDCDFYDPVFHRGRGPSDWLYRVFQMVRRLRHG